MPRKGENIRKRKDGRWEGRYRNGFSPDGTYRYSSVYGKSYSEVKNKLLFIKHETACFRSNPFVEKRLCEVLALWLAANQIKVKRSTASKYSYMIERHINPQLGTKKLSSLSAPLINRFLFDKLQHGRLDGIGGLSASYDTTTAISYLVQSKFKHIDLLKVIENENKNLYVFYEIGCQSSFIRHFKNKRHNTYVEIISNDWKTYYLYFLYRVERSRHNNMSSFGFFKSFFDRMTAHLAFAITLDPSDRKPNYKKYYKDKMVQRVFASVPGSDTIISTAFDLRNANPVAHSSAGLIDRNDSEKAISQSISDLNKLIRDFCTAHSLIK